MNEPLSDQLKSRTLVPHQELEKALVARMRAMRSVYDYITLLQVFYRYFGAIEERLGLFIGPAKLPDYLQRRKSEILAIDILALGGVLPEKVTLAEIPVIEDHFQAFGALYVIEGSTLGGQIISQMIAKQIGIQDKGLAYFHSYGDNLGTMWAAFKLVLNRQAANESDSDRIIGAADATFRKFQRLVVL